MVELEACTVELRLQELVGVEVAGVGGDGGEEGEEDGDVLLGERSWV